MPAEARGAEEGGRRRGRRPFDYGALRLVVLGMIAERPRHGYDLMKAIEERMGGGYSPSPGVIYPTLAWLEDMGYAFAETESGTGAGRRSFRLTPEGAAFLAANRAALAEIKAGMGGGRGGGRDTPEPVLAAMDALKRALRARFAQGPADEEGVARIAEAIHAAARHVEDTMMTEARPLKSVAVVQTPKAEGYLAQLCKHFAHKIPVSHEDGRGEIAFSAGACRLEADGERLTLTVEAADPAALAQLQEVVESHLLRFAFREELALDWRAG